MVLLSHVMASTTWRYVLWLMKTHKTSCNRTTFRDFWELTSEQHILPILVLIGIFLMTLFFTRVSFYWFLCSLFFFWREVLHVPSEKPYVLLKEALCPRINYLRLSVSNVQQFVIFYLYFFPQMRIGGWYSAIFHMPTMFFLHID